MSSKNLPLMLTEWRQRIKVYYLKKKKERKKEGKYSEMIAELKTQGHQCSHSCYYSWLCPAHRGPSAARSPEWVAPCAQGGLPSTAGDPKPAEGKSYTENTNSLCANQHKNHIGTWKYIGTRGLGDGRLGGQSIGYRPVEGKERQRLQMSLNGEDCCLGRPGFNLSTSHSLSHLFHANEPNSN